MHTRVFIRIAAALPALACAVWLAGCAAPPQAEAPVAALPAAYPALPPATSAGGQPLPALRWDELLAAPQLQRLQQAALAHNSDLRVAALRVEEARAAAGLQRAASRPVLAAGAQGLRGQAPLPLEPIAPWLDGLPPALAAPLAQSLQEGGRELALSSYVAGVMMPAYEIDFWGKLRALDQAARERYLASAEAQQAFRTALLALVTDGWLQGLELQERLYLARQTLAANEESQRIMQRRQAVGLISDMELRQAETLVASTRGELAALERQYAANRALLGQLTQLHALPPAPGERPLSALPERTLPAGLPSALLTRRPDIRAAEHQLQAARANVQAARAAVLPSISLTAGGGVASSALGDLFDHGRGSWLFVPRITLPLFDGGRREANLALAEARKHQAVAQYEGRIQAAFKEVSELLAAHHWLGEQVQQVRALVAAQADRAALASKRYERGYSSYFEVLDAERSRFAAEQSLVQLQRARLSTLVGLYKALGGEAASPEGSPETSKTSEGQASEAPSARPSSPSPQEGGQS